MTHSTAHDLGSTARALRCWDWLYEIKHNGFRALTVTEQKKKCRFFSRKKHRVTGHRDLQAALVKEVNAETAILDGELDGRSSRPKRLC
jgi:ATP-dependent DNA ligase